MNFQKVSGWTMTESDLSTHLGHLEPEDQALGVWCYRWCNDPAHPIPMAEFARQLGVAENTTYKVFAGKYTEADNKTLRRPPGKLLAAMREFKDMEERRFKLGSVKFCMTPTAETVFTACEFARESRTPVFVYGASHIGKTMAFKEYQLRKTDTLTYYVRMRAASGVVGMVKLLAKAFGVSTKLTKDKMVDEIIAKLTPNTVIILDECHLLTNTYRRESFFNCFETIRDIWDSIECGIVLVFTNIGKEKVEQEKRGELEQLFRRGIHRFSLGEQPTRKDLSMIVRSWGLEMPKRGDECEVTANDGEVHKRRPYDVLRDLSRAEGLKSITERLRYSRKLAAMVNAEVSWRHFLTAHFAIEQHGIAPANWN